MDRYSVGYENTAGETASETFPSYEEAFKFWGRISGASDCSWADVFDLDEGTRLAEYDASWAPAA